ncbi:MAG TPA: hypothetical protein VLA99_03180 [Nitrospiraceae bacterium]|nr:hypothetical protein [Nitrospiraceae bacterium]
MTSLWHRHQACRTTQDRDHLRRLSDELHRAALEEQAGLVAIPGLLRSLVSAPPVRTAIDPKAVAAACLARAGSLAQAVGDRPEAERVVRLIVEHYAEPDYAFYLDLAQGRVRNQGEQAGYSPVGPASVSRRPPRFAHRMQEHKR